MNHRFSEDMRKVFETPAPPVHASAAYDEFCLVTNFNVNPLQSVQLIPVHDPEKAPTHVATTIQQRRKKRRPPAPV